MVVKQFYNDQPDKGMSKHFLLHKLSLGKLHQLFERELKVDQWKLFLWDNLVFLYEGDKLASLIQEHDSGFGGT